VALKRHFLRFSAIGVIGFLVDSATLYLSLGLLGLGFYTGRVLSFLVAATTTWFLNRQVTFTDADRSKPLRQWRRFIAANALGGLVNYGVYATIVSLVPPAVWVPLAGVAAGSIAGLAFNFTASRRLVFRPAG
jgi:putative flippase GtrA